MKLQEDDYEVKQDDDQHRTTGFLRRIVVAGQGGVTLSYVCPHCHPFPLEDHILSVSMKHGEKRCNWWCAACGRSARRPVQLKGPNRDLVFQDSADPSEGRSFGPTRHLKVRAIILCVFSSCLRTSRRAEAASWKRSSRVFRNHGRPEKFHRGEDRRPGEELGGDQKWSGADSTEMFPDAAFREGCDTSMR